jgi:hypothetical protein
MNSFLESKTLNASSEKFKKAKNLLRESPWRGEIYNLPKLHQGVYGCCRLTLGLQEREL